MIVKEPTSKEKLEGYERTRTYIRRRLKEATIALDGVQHLYGRAGSGEERAAIIDEVRVASKKVQHWSYLLSLLQPPPKVLTGIFPGAGRDEINRRRKAGE
jgi:hypothetical protein